MKLKNLFEDSLTKAVGTAWLVRLDLGETDDTDLDAIKIFANEKAVIKYMLDIMQAEISDDSDLKKESKKLTTLEATMNFIKKHADLQFYDDVFEVHKTKIEA